MDMMKKSTFTSRKNEAKEIIDDIQKENIKI